MVNRWRGAMGAGRRQNLERVFHSWRGRPGAGRWREVEKVNQYRNMSFAQRVCSAPASGVHAVPSRSRTLIAVAVVWHLCFLAFAFVCGPSVGLAINAAYVWSFGDIQASFGRYER